jgi:hypothetical protein
MSTYEEIEKKENCSCGVLRYTQEEMLEMKEKEDNQIIKIEYYGENCPCGTKDILKKFKSLADVIGLKFNSRITPIKNVDDALLEEYTIFLEGKRKDIKSFDDKIKSESFLEIVSLVWEFSNVEEFEKFKNNAILEGFDVAQLENGIFKGKSSLRCQVVGEKNKIENFENNWKSNMIYEGTGHLTALKWIGGASEALHQLARECGVDIKIDWDNGLLYKTAYFTVKGRKNNVNNFMQELDRIG